MCDRGVFVLVFVFASVQDLRIGCSFTSGGLGRIANGETLIEASQLFFGHQRVETVDQPANVRPDQPQFSRGTSKNCVRSEAMRGGITSNSHPAG